MKSRLLFIIILLLSVNCLFAGNFELVKVDFDYWAKDKVENTEEKVSASRLGATAAFPIILAGGRFVNLYKLSFEEYHFKFDQDYTDYPIQNIDSVGAISLNVVFRIALSKNFMLFAFAKPGVYTDHSAYNSDFMRYYYGGWIDLALSENTAIGLGALVNTNYGDPEYYAIIHFAYTNKTSFEFNFEYPSQAEAYYLFSANTKLGIKGKAASNRFKIEENKYANIHLIKFEDMAIGPILIFKIHENLKLQLYGAHSYKQWRYFDNTNTELKKIKVKQGLLFSTKLALVF